MACAPRDAEGSQDGVEPGTWEEAGTLPVDAEALRLR